MENPQKKLICVYIWVCWTHEAEYMWICMYNFLTNMEEPHKCNISVYIWSFVGVRGRTCVDLYVYMNINIYMVTNKYKHKRKYKDKHNYK